MPAELANKARSIWEESGFWTSQWKGDNESKEQGQQPWLLPYAAWACWRLLVRHWLSVRTEDKVIGEQGGAEGSWRRSWGPGIQIGRTA